MSRPALYLNGEPVETKPRVAWAPATPQPPVRPGCHPRCCGTIGNGNGGHEPDCLWRTRRVFDHLGGEPGDARFSKVAHAMRSEAWWRGIPIIVIPGDVVGEIAARGGGR